MLCGLSQPKDPNLIAGFEGGEDAGVYRIRRDLAIVQTIDFFPPIVDDPYIFGQIAAANSLSDVYAMGGTPITAMNVVAFPSKQMDISVLREILKGALSKMKEAGVTLVGGHSIEDQEIKFGLSVCGIIHPDKVVTNRGSKPGDELILTKPLGTGIINTAMKGELASQETIDKVQKVMVALNRAAAEAMIEVEVNACTDVTGFGLIGHLCEMVCGLPISAEVEISSVPIFPEALDFAHMGLVPAGTYNNRSFREGMVIARSQLSQEMLNLLFDPQTSGGLLISVPSGKRELLLAKLKEWRVDAAAVIGRIVEEPKGKVILL